MQNKKGMDIWNTVLVSFILGVAVLAFFGIPYLNAWVNTARGVGEDEKCRTAVEIAARTSMGKDLKECKAVPITIKYSKNENAVREQLAQTMKRCWDKFGANKQPPLNPFVNKNEFCAVCSINTFEGFSEDIGGVALYLAENKPSGEDRTYYEYFYGSPATDDVVKNYREDKTKFSTKVRYATVLYVTKEVNWAEIFKALKIDSVGGAASLAIPGVFTFRIAAVGGLIITGKLISYTPMVLLVPYDYSPLSIKCIDLGVEPFESYFS